MTRLLMVGDVHGDLPFMRRVVEYAQEWTIDLIIQLGDFGAYWPGGERFTRGLWELSETMPIYFLRGNHDNATFLDACVVEHGWENPITLKNQLTFLPDGCRFELGGKQFGVLGGGFSIDWRIRTPEVNWWPQIEMAEAEDLDRLGKERLDVLLTHDSPERLDHLAHQLGPFDEENCELTKRVIRDGIRATKPYRLFHGHWHHRYEDAFYYYDAAGNSSITRVMGLACNDDPLKDAIVAIDTSHLGMIYHKQ